MKLNKLKDIVINILREIPETRKSDFRLYAEVLRKLDFDLTNTTLHMFLYTASYYDAPPFESVSRARRLAQKLYPELKDKKVAEFRAEKEQEFIEFSLGL